MESHRTHLYPEQLAEFTLFHKRLMTWKPQEDLVFACPPTILSLPYTRPPLPDAIVNAGTGRLADQYPQNHVFLQLQKDLWNWVMFFEKHPKIILEISEGHNCLQNSQVIDMLHDLNGGMEAFKGKCWEKIRLDHSMSIFSSSICPALPEILYPRA